MPDESFPNPPSQVPPSYVQPGGGGGGAVPNYLVQSILVTLCCCLPFGIVAIVNAAQVNTKLQQGDLAGAQTASANAKKWCTWALIAGVIVAIISILLQVLGIGMGAAFAPTTPTVP